MDERRESKKVPWCRQGRGEGTELKEGNEGGVYMGIKDWVGKRGPDYGGPWMTSLDLA